MYSCEYIVGVGALAVTRASPRNVSTRMWNCVYNQSENSTNPPSSLSNISTIVIHLLASLQYFTNILII